MASKVFPEFNSAGVEFIHEILHYAETQRLAPLVDGLIIITNDG